MLLSILAFIVQNKTLEEFCEVKLTVGHCSVAVGIVFEEQNGLCVWLMLIDNVIDWKTCCAT